MSKIKFLIFMSLVAVLIAHAPGAAQITIKPFPPLGVNANGINEGPGGTPHYFGPFGNWAYSPLPSFGIASVTVTNGGTGYTAPIVTITDVYGTGTATDNTPLLGTAAVTAGAITGITVPAGSKGFHVPFVTITDLTGTGAAATAILDATPVGGMIKFVDTMPGLGPTNANNLGQYIPVAVAQNVTFSGQAAEYYEIALVEFTEKMHSSLPPTRLRGYVQIYPPGGAHPVGAVQLYYLNASGNPDTTKPILFNGSPVFGYDKPHYLGPIIVAKGSAHGVAGAAGNPTPVRIKFYNLLPTGRADLVTGLRPGDLFLPVDETVVGSGYGPGGPGIPPGEKYTQNRATIHNHGNNTVWISDGNTHQWITPAGETNADGSKPLAYPKGVSVRNVPDMLDTTGGVQCDAPDSGCMTFFYTNAQSARLMFYHDHAMGITRLNVYAGEAAGYVITNAVEQDMIAGTNVSGVNIPGTTAGTFKKVLPDIGIPLVIQDRTWVEKETIFAQDPTWNWGTGPRDPVIGNITGAVTGDLWFPHVYMSAQKKVGGVNPFGRWHYGPWFNPPTPECVNGLPVGCIEVGPIPNEYHQADCSLIPPGPGCTEPWEQPLRPGVPNPSIPGEAFMDTPLVNGTAYPYMEVEPKAYRFRVLNAANDRMLNLQLYEAYDKTSWSAGTGSANPGSPTAACAADPAVCTEVKMIATAGQPNQLADWPSGIPDPATKGPAWWQIGTEGGFLPAPVVVTQQPVGWNLDPTAFNFGVVNQHSLLLGSAERADVVVDFTGKGGKTYILYNDAPAAFPAGVPVYDYFTGVGDQVDTGGAPNTQPGYGPNTRTIMQIRVKNVVPSTPTPDVTLANLQTVFAKGPGTKRGVFEVSQEPIILPQEAYNSAYTKTFPATDAAQYLGIDDTAKTFQPINEAGDLQPAITLPLEMKAMHDEMGGVYDTQFGRMSGMLGLTNPLRGNAFLIPYGYSSPPTDVVKGSLEGSPIGVMPDGTQIWRIFHNGVDSHTIHTHLFHAQLIQRLAQDGVALMPPDPEELGWKDTFRVNPLEITYLAMRPTVPTVAQLPFEVPDSVRLIDPTLPVGASLIPPPPAGWFGPDGIGIGDITNQLVNFGWEYVWHCHILAHEEMDMMHSLVFAVPPRPPAITGALVSGGVNNRVVTLNWTDNSIKEAGFTIQRATDANFTTGLWTRNVGPNVVTLQDNTVVNNTAYWYRVFALGPLVGDNTNYAPSLGFPTMSVDSVSGTQAVLVGTPTTTVPANPTLLTATVQSGQAGPQVRLVWRDNATNETGFAVERCTVVAPATTCSNFAQIAIAPPKNNTGNVPAFVDTTVTAGNTYFYQVWAVNAVPPGRSAGPTNATAAAVPAIPAAPTSFTVSVVKSGKNYTATLNWVHPGGTSLTGFTIQRATNLTFTAGLNTVNPAAGVRSITQTLQPSKVYYYRIRSNNNISGSSAWKNALPFPTSTGP